METARERHALGGDFYSLLYYKALQESRKILEYQVMPSTEQ
jgi:hypothetical protein